MIRGILQVKSRMGNYHSEYKEFNDEKHYENYIKKLNGSGVKVIGFLPEFPVRILSTVGVLTVDAMGRVTDFDISLTGEPSPQGDPYVNLLKGIRFFNVEELRYWMKHVRDVPMLPREISILDIGYWTKDYQYMPPLTGDRINKKYLRVL